MRRLRQSTAIALLCTGLGWLCTAPNAAGATTAWTGTGDWFADAGNWSGGVPGAGDEAEITSGAVLLTNATAMLRSLTMNGGTLTFTNWTTKLAATNVTIAAGTVTLPPAYTNTVMSNRVWIAAAANVTIAAGASIDTDGKGYAGQHGPLSTHPPASGPGWGRSGGGGAGHGAVGGFANSFHGGQDYGSITNPMTPGSGGGYTSGLGGNGGGVVFIEATNGVVTINGVISASGADRTGNAGGGSGGTIRIDCRTLAGTSGVVRANGQASGASGSGQGAGGRIAVHYDAAAQATSATPAIAFAALPGNPTTTLKTRSYLGTLYLTDSQLLDDALSAINARVYGFTNWSPNSVTVSNCWVELMEPGFELNATNGITVAADGRLAMTAATCGGDLALNNGTFTLYGGSWGRGHYLQRIYLTNETAAMHTLVVGGDVSLSATSSLAVYAAPTNGAQPDYGAMITISGAVTIASNATIAPHSQRWNGGSAIFAMDSLTIDAGGRFDAVGTGYMGGDSFGTAVADGVHIRAGRGPGGGWLGLVNSWGRGGGYGGTGGLATATSGEVYGSTNAPAAPGSGGGGGVARWGGYGGGLVRLNIAGDLLLNGAIAADGEGNGTRYGGGSGGGVYIRCSTFRGSGALTATGGDAGNTASGSGGGGRIAVWHGVAESEVARILAGDLTDVLITNVHPRFSGTLSATNGAPIGVGTEGTPGTIVFLSIPPPAGTLLLMR